MYLFKTLKSLSKYSKQLTRSSQQLNAVPHQTINKNRKSMNKEYYVSEVEDKSSVEYSKKRSV